MESFYSAKKILKKLTSSEFVKHMLKFGNYSESTYVEKLNKMKGHSKAKVARLEREARTGKRVCYQCHRLKLLEDYYLESKTRSVRKRLCKTCCAKRAKANKSKVAVKEIFEKQTSNNVRTCRSCMQTKSLMNFYRCRRRLDPNARDTICKQCVNKDRSERAKAQRQREK